MAAVAVSVVYVMKGEAVGPFRLDDRQVPLITAFLFHAGGSEAPERLTENYGMNFIGSYVLGMGFTFDDANPDATSLAEMSRLIESNPRNAERIFPYLGGEELNTSPTHSPNRYVINFGALMEAEARNWPDLMAIVETKVKPEREKVKRDAHRLRWWQYGDKRAELYENLSNHERCLAATLHSKDLAFTWLPTGCVFSHALGIFPFQQDEAFAVLQSRIHEVWARFFGSSLEDRLRYTPTDCFETFPFPSSWNGDMALEMAGKDYHAHRAALMVRNNVGLTKTYNRFHHPDDASPDILRLRSLHDAMDRAVLDAYGWTDLRPACAFLLDCEDEDDENDDSGGTRERKKPWRYRWPDDFRDEVLARLLALNNARAETGAALTTGETLKRHGSNLRGSGQGSD